MSHALREIAQTGTDDELLIALQREASAYFHDTEPGTIPWLTRDRTHPDSPCSIAAVGFRLASLAVSAERGRLPRAEAAARVVGTLRFFDRCEQSDRPDAAGYRGFYYHFLDRKSGKRTWNCELSSIDTALLIAGALTAALYFTGDTADEREIVALAGALYRRVEWDWMLAGGGGTVVSQGWKPGSGFLPYGWWGYSEGMLLLLLALGAPEHTLPESVYAAFQQKYRWCRLYGYEYLYAGPLFIHQMPHCFVDFRGISDAYMRARGTDYFENSRRATMVQREYAIRNPRNFAGYGPNCWGITASDGPGPARQQVEGRLRHFFEYKARGVPFGPDDGSISPWAAVTSLPFAPTEVLASIRHFLRMHVGEGSRFGFESTFNPTFTSGRGKGAPPWISPYHYGLNQGPIVLMIENYLTDFIWRLWRGSPFLQTGLRRAGFSGGWLG